MNENLKEFFLKTAYAIVGIVVSSFVGFLHANPAEFGASTAVIVGICSVVEQYFFSSPPSTPSA